MGPRAMRRSSDHSSTTTAGNAPADVVLLRGNILTLDARHPRVSGVAIRGEEIVATGSDAEMKSWTGPATRVVDLHGEFATAGFNDAHVHIGSAGRGKLAIDIEGARSLEEFQQRIRSRLPDFRPGEWMTGRGWDHTLWPGQRFPTRNELDAVSADRPMFFVRVDGHVGVANSLALKLAGIDSQTPDPHGGRILRDTLGEPTGLLEEDAAMQLVTSRIPAPGPSQRRRGIELALAEAARYGVTSLQDCSSWDDFLVYQELKREGKLPLRITEWLPFEEPLAKLEEMRRAGGTDDPWLRTGAVKGYMDGSLGSRTAAMLAPYSDDPASSGILRMEADYVTRLAIERDRAGFQINLHAIGDRANRVALDAFEAVRKANGPRDRRDRIEHAQVLAPEDVKRFAALGVIASMQPSHLLTDVRWAEQRLGPERSKGAYAWHSLESSGARLALGTDYPVESINPMRGVYACLTRQTTDGKPSGGWEPQERIGIEDCLRAYTQGAAYAVFEEGSKGEIAPGRFADIVVLSRDITSASPAEVLTTEVVLTMAGGRITYESK
jgi:predicted amidohydrolase YtcJ